MRRLGMSDAQVALVRTLIAQTPSVPAPPSFVAAIPTIVGLNARNGDIAACTCRPPG